MKAFLDAAEDAKKTNEKEYYAFLGEHFGEIKGDSYLYDLILSIPFLCYLTVNYDPSLAWKWTLMNKNPKKVLRAYPALYQKDMIEGSIHYLHGYIEENSIPASGTIVLASSEFTEAYADNGNARTFLGPTFENEHVLFMGCRLEEPMMPELFEISAEKQLNRLRIVREKGYGGKELPQRFIVLPKQKEEVVDQGDGKSRGKSVEEQEKHYEAMGITPVWYELSEGKHTSLEIALRNLANVSIQKPKYGF